MTVRTNSESRLRSTQSPKLPRSGLRAPLSRTRLLCPVALALVLAACAGAPEPPYVAASFDERCAAPGVVRCFGFDSAEATDAHLLAPSGSEERRAGVDFDLAASGGGSLRFEIPSHSGADTSGSFWLNFSDDLATQFGEGDEFFVQWRQRFSREMLRTDYLGGGGWKQIIIGEGDRPGHTAWSCTQLEIVVNNQYQRGYPAMYHSCGAKDNAYEPIDDPYPFPYESGEWMTFQVGVTIGDWYLNDGRYHRNSAVRLWVAREGRPAKRVIDRDDYDIANENPGARYGKLWLLPYHTGKDSSQDHPVAYTWYDELIISRQRIADP